MQTQTNTHIHTSLLPVSPAHLPSVRAPGAWSCLPATQAPLGGGSPEGRRCGWGTPQRLSPCCPGAPAFTPAAASRANQSAYDNLHIPPDREDNTHTHTFVHSWCICTQTPEKYFSEKNQEEAETGLLVNSCLLFTWYWCGDSLWAGWQLTEGGEWSIPHDRQINKEKQANTQRNTMIKSLNSLLMCTLEQERVHT